MEVNIKGSWQHYDYCIDCSHTAVETIIDSHMEAQNVPIAYIGKSKAIRNEDGTVEQLKRRCIFFIYIKTELIDSNWTKYDWNDESTRPPVPGRYLIYREKCDKMHFEQWNGSGWASSNKDCTHWQLPEKPKTNVSS